MNKIQKEIISTLIGSLLVVIYLGMLSLIIGESAYQYLGDGWFVFTIAVGTVAGKYVGYKFLDR